LRGVQRGRDAIGATAHVTTGRRTITRQLTAGDGFAASNERQLIFGLGDQDRVAELRIDWPGGASQVFFDLAADQRLLIVEGREAPAVLPVPTM
jgi:hypothetical protein